MLVSLYLTLASLTMISINSYLYIDLSADELSLWRVTFVVINTLSIVDKLIFLSSILHYKEKGGKLNRA